jgi:hypothetical protein
MSSTKQDWSSSKTNSLISMRWDCSHIFLMSECLESAEIQLNQALEDISYPWTHL